LGGNRRGEGGKKGPAIPNPIGVSEEKKVLRSIKNEEWEGNWIRGGGDKTQKEVFWVVLCNWAIGG